MRFGWNITFPYWLTTFLHFSIRCCSPGLLGILYTAFIQHPCPVLRGLPKWLSGKETTLGWEDSLEDEMVTYSSVLAWRIPQTEEPSGLQSIGSQRVRHYIATEYTCTHTWFFNLSSPLSSQQTLEKEKSVLFIYLFIYLLLAFVSAVLISMSKRWQTLI